MVLSLTNDEVESLLGMADTIRLIEQAFRAEADGRAVNIPRSDMILPLGPDDAYVFKVHPGMIEDFSVAALRVQSDHIAWPGDRKVKRAEARGDNFVQFVLAFDTETTEPIVLFNDGWVSKMRVGATNAVAAKYLGRPDATALGLLGTGRQATGQLLGFAEVLDLDRVRVYSPTREHREAFANEWNEAIDPSVVAVDSAREAVHGVDVLACASNSMSPIFDPEWIEPGMHVSAIKNPEVPDAAFNRVDRVVVTTTETPHGPHNYAPRGADFGDRLTDAWTVSGFDLGTASQLGDYLVTGGARNPEETTLFLNNLGVGIQFAAVARHLLETAREAELGIEIDTTRFLQPIW